MKRLMMGLALLTAFGLGAAVGWFVPLQLRARDAAEAGPAARQALATVLSDTAADAVGEARWDGERHVVPLTKNGVVVAYAGLRRVDGAMAVVELGTPTRSWRPSGR